MLTIVLGALIGLLVKLALDTRSEHQNMRSVAAALAGEMHAYLRLSQPDLTIENLRKIAGLERDVRVAALRGAFSNLPSGHPVFDRVADKIGILSPDASRGVSEAYNIFTGIRLMLANFSSEPFLNSFNERQTTQILVLTTLVEQELDGMLKTAAMLDALSRQSFTEYVRNRYWDRS